MALIKIDQIIRNPYDLKVKDKQMERIEAIESNITRVIEIGIINQLKNIGEN